MTEAHSTPRRVRFFGPNDLAAHWHAGGAAEIAEAFDPDTPLSSATDAIELHNVRQYLEMGLFPSEYDEPRRARAAECVRQMRSTIARFFTAIDEASLDDVVADIDRDYHADLLELLGRNGAFERFEGDRMFAGLRAAGVHLREMLANRKFVASYDSELRGALLASHHNAEHVVRKFLQKDVRDSVHLPKSFTSDDAHALMQAYVESSDANPNYVGLIESAQVRPDFGVDAKLKLLAKRRRRQMNEEFFSNNEGIRYGCEISLSSSQGDPVEVETDGLTVWLRYSEEWLEECLDYPSILNNFQHLFDFADSQVLLTLPAYPSQLGIFERFIFTTGKTDYHIGAAFRAKDICSHLQVRFYRDFLASREIDLEHVVRWFFEDFISCEYGAHSFSFTPSGGGSTYLQRTRHLLAEMDSVAQQYSLYALHGELDRELLEITSEPVSFKELPSRVADKYAYKKEHDEVASVLFHLFSDQSGLTYITEELQADSGAELLIQHRITYDEFADHQKPIIDHLVDLGVLRTDGESVAIASAAQLEVLSSLYHSQGASYFHLTAAGRQAADAMVAREWIARRSSLLSDAEASYFNYFLNRREFSNGPELRNKYVHGSQPNADGEDSHFHAYLIVVRLIIALVIKFNDDLQISATLHDESGK